MRHRLTGAILLLYPRRVREGHGPEIVALIDDLVAHEGRSRARLFIGLAVDGLVQRVASTATVWTVVAVLLATSFGGLAVSDFAAANATTKAVPRAVPTVSRGPGSRRALPEARSGSERTGDPRRSRTRHAFNNRPRTSRPAGAGGR